MKNFRPKQLRHSIVVFIFLSVSFIGSSLASEGYFHEILIVSPYKITHPIIAADIVENDGKELITFTVDEKNQRRLIVYGFDQISQDYQILDEVILDTSIYSFDISKEEQGRQQSIYFLGDQKLMRYLPVNEQSINTQTNEKLELVAEISSLVMPMQAPFINRGSFVKQLNSDPLDDFVIADFSGVGLYLSKAGAPLTHSSLPIKPYINLGKSRITYRQPIFYICDVNADGQKDIVTINQQGLQVYAQQSDTQFASSSFSVPLASRIHAKDWFLQQDSMGESLDQSNLQYRKLEALRDINNDGIVDMIVRYSQSSGVLDKTNDYEVYLGAYQQEKLTYQAKPSSVIKAEGTLTGLEIIDVNNDDIYEVLLSGFDIGLSEIIGALLAGSIDQDVFVFKMDANGNYVDKPNTAKDVELNFSLSSGQSGSPVVKLADINGDNYQDLILSKNSDSLHLYVGKSGSKLFAKKRIIYKTLLPQNGSTLRVTDLNNDGKDDLLFKYGKLDGAKLAQTFKVLLAQDTMPY